MDHIASRRKFIIGAGLLGAGALAAACAESSQTPSESTVKTPSNVFPENLVLGENYLRNPDNYLNIIKASSELPTYKIDYTPGVNSINVKVPEGIQKSLEQFKMTDFQIGELTDGNMNKYLGFRFKFPSPVKLGPDFMNLSGTPWPAFLTSASNSGNIEKEIETFHIHTAAGYDDSMRSGETNANEPLKWFTVFFEKSFENSENQNLSLIFNTKLFDHLPNRAEFFPAKFSISINKGPRALLENKPQELERSSNIFWPLSGKNA